MAATSPEARARKHLNLALSALREGAHEREFSISFNEVLGSTERAVEWLDDLKYMKSPYVT